jgi:heme/copper-type cytochrome/quinol oxidase subunit 2
MSRTTLNFFLDLLLLLITISLIWTSCVLKFVFPPATGAVGWTLWGLSYDAWADLQFSLLAVIVLAILVHIMLHWSWVCGVVQTRFLRRRGKAEDGSQTLYGVSLLVAILLTLSALLLVAQLAVRGPTV